MRHVASAIALVVLAAGCGGDDAPSAGELFASVEGMGSVIVTSDRAAGISCIDGTGTCRTDIEIGEVLTVSAQAGAGHDFDRWQANGLQTAFDDTPLPQQVTIVADEDGAAPSILLTAFFVPQTASCTPTGTAPNGPPTDITVTPSSSCVGGRVTIAASNVSDDGNACVTIGGADVELELVLPANVGVPAEATPGTGKITVTTTGGTATSDADFTVAAGALPDIDTAEPMTAPAATVVTLTGTGLAGATVSMNGPTSETPAVTASSATSLQFTVPGTVVSGSYFVSAAVAGCGASSTSATLTVP